MTDGTGTSTYAYDSLGRLTRSVSGTGLAVGYGYDLANQLTSLDYPGGAGTVSRGYDGAGNLVSVTDWAGRRTTFGYDPDGGLSAVGYPNGVHAARGYDPAGRATSLTYTAPGGATLAEFSATVDGAGLVSAVTGTGTPGGDQAYGYDPANRLSTHNGRALGYDPAGQLTRLAEGTTLGYDAAGQLSSTTTAAGRTGTRSTPFGFAGSYTDPETGLVYLRARYYDPATANFLTRDPLADLTGTPYGYAEGNPVSNTDPLGLFCLLGRNGHGSCRGGGVYTYAVMHFDPVYYVIDGYAKEWSAAANGCSLATVAKYGLEGVAGVAATAGVAIGGAGLVGSVLAADGEVGLGGITGYTRHGLMQAIGRDGHGVSPAAILDAVKGPTRISRDATRGTITFIGKTAVVVLNAAGKVVTTWATNSQGWRY